MTKKTRTAKKSGAAKSGAVGRRGRATSAIHRHIVKTSAEKANVILSVRSLADASDIGTLRAVRDLLLDHVTVKVGKFRALAIACAGEVDFLP